MGGLEVRMQEWHISENARHSILLRPNLYRLALSFAMSHPLSDGEVNDRWFDLHPDYVVNRRLVYIPLLWDRAVCFGSFLVDATVSGRRCFFGICEVCTTSQQSGRA